MILDHKPSWETNPKYQLSVLWENYKEKRANNSFLKFYLLSEADNCTQDKSKIINPYPNFV